MHSQVTVRLPEDLDREVTSAAKRLRRKRFDDLRLALEQLLLSPQVLEAQTPSGKVEHLLGAVEGGIADLGFAHREHLIKRIRRHG